MSPHFRTGSSFDGNGEFETARPASESIFSFCADGKQPCAAFIINPATRALEIGPDSRPKLERTLRREAYLFAFRLYLRLPSIYFRLFLIECRNARFRILRYFF